MGEVKNLFKRPDAAKFYDPQQRVIALGFGPETELEPQWKRLGRRSALIWLNAHANFRAALEKFRETAEYERAQAAARTPGGHPNSPTCGHPKFPHLSTHSRG